MGRMGFVATHGAGFWYERDDVDPFWAVTRYADVMTVSDNPQIFINGGPRLRLTLKGRPELLRAGVDSFGQERDWDPDEPPDMVFMDNPRHRYMRKHSSWAFTQGSMRKTTNGRIFRDISTQTSGCQFMLTPRRHFRHNTGIPRAT